VKQTGFGLIQLLTGITLIAIVAQFAVPGFAQLIEAQRRDDAARQLASGMRSARTEAIMRNQVVLIHAIDDDWSLGWRIIVDHNGAGAGDESNPVLVERASSGKVPIVGNAPVKRFVRFNGLGAPLHASGGFLAGTLHVCDTKQSASYYQVALSKTGRVSLRSNKTENTLCHPV
jgi:type IV fimbrial biogenesis protein FimT